MMINHQQINMVHVAAQSNALYSVAYFLKKVGKGKGLGIDTVDSNDCTALHWSCISHSHQVTKLLLDWGADPNAQDSEG